MYNKLNFKIAKHANSAQASGLIVYPDKTVAIDGRYLIEMSIPAIDAGDLPEVNINRSELFSSFVLDKEDAKSIQNLIPKGGEKVPKSQQCAQVQVDDDTVSFATDATVTTVTRRRNIADYEKVLPSVDPVSTLLVSPKILGEVCAVAKQLGAKSLKVEIFENQIVVYGKNDSTGQKMKAMVMLMRDRTS